MRVGSDEANEIANSLRSRYERILQDYGIHVHTTGVQVLVPKDDTYRSRDTLIIYTYDEDSQRWKEAATEIQEILDKALEERTAKIEIRVEIRNPDKMYRDTSSIIRPGTTIHEACMKVESAVYKVVKKSCPNDWTSISYWMRGPSCARDDKDRKPTVIVTVTPRTTSLWWFVEDQVVEAVDSVGPLGVDLYVEILPGYAQLLLSQEMKPPNPIIYRYLQETPVNGVSIGARGASMEAGSLGTWVYFQPAGSAKKQKCFLTCYHVIAPGDPAHRASNDFHGIGLNGRKVEKYIKVDYPAPFDATPTKAALQSEVAQGKDPNGKKAQILNVIDKYISAGGIGSVIYASGYLYLNSKNRRMDWALVGVYSPNSFQQNKPPSGFTYLQLWNGKLEYEVRPDEVVTNIGTPVKGEWMAKIGRSTGTTVGEVNSLETAVHWQNGKESTEISVGSAVGGSDFVNHGDSGAMVFNLKKEWIGIALGKLSTNDSGIVTSAQDLIDDIKARTGGTISLA
jgi:hypothetical protein